MTGTTVNAPRGIEVLHARTAAQLADVLGATPGSPLDGLLRTTHGDRWRAPLAAASTRITEGELRVVFGGRFSCGKSALLNTVLGRDLLPESDYPETGVPCEIRSGPVDRVQADMASGRVGLPFGTASIAQLVSLIDDDGELRDSVRELRRLQLRLRTGGPAAGVVWVDSPGIDDSAEMNERAAAAARDADVLVWVVSSKQPLGETEQAFLHEYVATHGAGGIVFVVNVFLPKDDAFAWSSYLAERAGWFRARVADVGLDPGGRMPVVAFCSARAARHDTGFGGLELRRLVAGLGDGPCAVSSSRCHAAMLEVGRIAAEVSVAERAERARITEEIARRNRAIAQLERSRSAFRAWVEAAFPGAYDRAAARIAQHVDDVVAEMNGGPLRYDDSYGARLSRALDDVAQELRDDIVGAVEGAATRNGRGPLAPETARRVTAALRLPRAVIDVPRLSAGAGGGAGAVVGGILGTIIAPVIGSAIGAALGAAAGKGGTMLLDRSTAIANARAAGAAATAALHRTVDTVRSLVLDPVATTPLRPGPPPAATADALRDLRQELDGIAAELRELAAPGPS